MVENAEDSRDFSYYTPHRHIQAFTLKRIILTTPYAALYAAPTRHKKCSIYNSPHKHFLSPEWKKREEGEKYILYTLLIG